jgi:undecaprenyl diphosphate synthase
MNTAPIDPARIPRHVAVIMDGNGRWAQAKGLPRHKGHEAGAESVRAVMESCRDLGIKYLTLYAFSVENWVRPQDEIKGLMQLLKTYLEERAFELHENKVRLRVMGRKSDLPKAVQIGLNRVIKATADYTESELILALSYGGRAELTDAVREIARKVEKGDLKARKIDESTIASHLYLPDVPDPDLMIRTSGEMRISNFLLWQLSYAELYVTNTMWPDFRKDHFRAAIEDYSKRTRRFGDISAEEQK